VHSGFAVRQFFTLTIVAVAALALAGCEATTPTATTTDVVDRIAFVDGERLTYELVNIQGEPLGTGVLTTRLEGTRFVLEQHYESDATTDAEPSTDDVTVAVDAATLRPFGGLRSVVRRLNDGGRKSEVYEWIYDVDDEVSGIGYSATIDGESSRDELELREHYYDNESSLWLWRTLAFSEEFEANYVSVNPLDGKQQTVKIQTPSRETIDVPAGTFEVWRLIVRNGRSLRSAWINVEAPHEVVQWDNGDVIFRLQSRELVD
jgi:Protein of unknown function (DUF3108)